MTQHQVFAQIVTILRPFVKRAEALNDVTMETSILRDLKVNSARLVDVVLEMEEAFGIAIRDEQTDRLKTVGDAVKLVLEIKA